MIAAGFDNGDIKLFDPKAMKLQWSTNILNGVCSLQFDRLGNFSNRLKVNVFTVFKLDKKMVKISIFLKYFNFRQKFGFLGIFLPLSIFLPKFGLLKNGEIWLKIGEIWLKISEIWLNLLIEKKI